MQTGTYSRPETTYYNNAGGGILSLLRQMEEKVNWLDALEAEVNRLGALEAKVSWWSALEAEVVMLCPLRKSAVGNWARFFTILRVQTGMGGIGLWASIDHGNEIAHGSDVVTDICLLKHGLIQYH